MTVEIFPLNALGGAAGVVVPTFLNDPMTGVTGPLGFNYIQTVSPTTPIVDPITSGTYSIGVCADAQQGMIVSNVGTGNPGSSWSGGFIVAPLYISCFGQTQFCEFKIVAISRVGANDSVHGPAIFQSNPGQQAVGSEQKGLFSYKLNIRASDLSYFVGRGNAAVGVQLITGGAGSWAAGDVCRLSGQVNPGDITLRVTKNGVLFATAVDNSAGRFSTGGPGFFSNLFDNSAGGSMISQWRNFRGGLGLG